jgi:hypothetical protein
MSFPEYSRIARFCARHLATPKQAADNPTCHRLSDL